MLSARTIATVAAATFAAGAADAHAAFTITRTGAVNNESVTVRGGGGEDQFVVSLLVRPADVDVEEVVTVVGSGGSVVGTDTGCRATTDNKGLTTATCTMVRGGTVSLLPGGGDDTVRVDGSIAGVELAPGRRAVEVALDRGDDRFDSSVSGVPFASVLPAVRARGDDGDDILTARGAGALLEGGEDDDRLIAEGATESVLLGADGDDRLAGGDRSDRLDGGPGADILEAGDGGDVLDGGPGEDTLDAAGGDDLVDGGTGGDRIDGGPGADTVAYDTGPRANGVSVTLDGLCNDGGPEDTRPAAPVNVAPSNGCAPNGVDRDRVLGVETLRGTPRADTLVGGDLPVQLFGLAGDDVVEGGRSADTLIGGQGVDTVLGRDEAPDTTIACGDGVPPGVTQVPSPPGDRAVIDQFDPVNPDCSSIERGGQGVTGPQDERPAPQPPPPGQAAPPPAAPAPASTFTTLNGGGELGTLPGGGVPGKAPQLKLLERRATVDSRGRLPLRIACVYQARQCVSTVTLTARSTLRAGKGRKAVRIKKGATIGRASAAIPWGRSQAVRVQLTRTMRKLVAARRAPTAVRLKVVARDGGQPADAKAVTLTGTVTIGRGRR